MMNPHCRDGDRRYEAWWNALLGEERMAVLVLIKLANQEQQELFCGMLWHELHDWLRRDLRILFNRSRSAEHL